MEVTAGKSWFHPQVVVLEKLGKLLQTTKPKTYIFFRVRTTMHYVTIHPRHVCIYVTIHPGQRCTSCLLLLIVTIYFVTFLHSPLFYIRDAIHLQKEPTNENIAFFFHIIFFQSNQKKKKKLSFREALYLCFCHYQYQNQNF